MDHRQQNSGRAWGMICDRIFVGLIFFQLTTAGQLLLQKAFARSALVIPLVIATFWISIVYGKTYKPLMKFIALSSVRRGEHEHETERDRYRDDPNAEDSYAPSLSSMNLAPERNVWGYSSEEAAVRRRRRELAEEMRFVNPSLVAPLGKVWIAHKDLRRENGRQEEAEEGEGHRVEPGDEEESA